MEPSRKAIPTTRRAAAEGSVITDAAVCLPLFLIALCILLSMIRQIGLEESVVRGMTESSIRTVESISALQDTEGYQLAGAAAWQLFWSDYKDREWPEAKPETAALPAVFGRTDHTEHGLCIDGLADARVVFSGSLPSFGMGPDRRTAEKSISFRPFIGASQGNVSAYDTVRVYVFPKAGERYHSASCYILKEGAVETVLNGSLRRRCAGCRL